MSTHCTRCLKQECYLQGKDCFPLSNDPRERMNSPDVAAMMTAAAAIESEGYGHWTRLEEIAIFARKMGYRTLGMAFCIGLLEEARVFEAYLQQSFTVHSVCCKLGGIDKKELGLPPLQAERPHESTCNPIGQALLLAEKQTDLNLLVGLCIGHDILFTQHSRAPVTTLLVKDRVLAHNPAGVIYSRYHRNRLSIK